jgi:hypothetical protein
MLLMRQLRQVASGCVWEARALTLFTAFHSSQVREVSAWRHGNRRCSLFMGLGRGQSARPLRPAVRTLATIGAGLHTNCRPRATPACAVPRLLRVLEHCLFAGDTTYRCSKPEALAAATCCLGHFSYINFLICLRKNVVFVTSPSFAWRKPY